MDNEKEKSLKALQMAFVGKIIADFTHEIKNHLAFIKESAGLIEDIIGTKKSIGKQEIQQTVDVLRSIVEQIGKSVNMFNYLNRFSHRMDHPVSTFNINDTLEELVVLLGRYANQKQISLNTDFQKDIPPISSDPVSFQFIIFCIIEEMLKTLDKRSSILIRTDYSRDKSSVQIFREGNIIPAAEEGRCSFEILKDIVQKTGWSIIREDKKIILELPVS